MFDVDTDTIFIVADFSHFDDMVAGVAFAYSDTGTATAFNSGASDTDGFTIAPYMPVCSTVRAPSTDSPKVMAT